MTIVQLIILCSALLIAGIVAFIIIAHKQRKSSVPAKLCLVVSTLMFVGLIFSAVSIHFAVERGMTTMDITIPRMMQGIANSPIEQSSELRDEYTSTLIYIYRFDCSDCNALHEQTMNALSPYTYICVSSRTPGGKNFIQDKDIDSVPSVVAYNSKGEFKSGSIYVTDENENPVFDQKAFDELVEFMNT